MTALVWDQLGQRTYESGVNQGVLYLPDGSGVSWNGLTSVEERTSGSASTPLYFEGLKYNEITSISDFSASLKAYTYPDEFLEFEGLLQPESGFYVTGQMSRLFGLSYRTRISNDVNPDAGYKLHVLCNLNATPSNKSYQTQSDQQNAVEFEWTITSIPARISGFRPTSHLIFDSTKLNPTIMQDVEDILYGTDTTDATLPEFSELVGLVTAV